MGDLIPRIGSVFAPLAVKVASGIIVALLVAIVALVWRADALSGQRDDALKEVGATQLKLDVSNASLEVLIAQNEEWVEEGRIRQEEAVEAINEARDAGDEMRRAAQEQGRTDWRGVEGL